MLADAWLGRHLANRAADPLPLPPADRLDLPRVVLEVVLVQRSVLAAGERPQHATVVAGGGAAGDLPAKRLLVPSTVLEVVLVQRSVLAAGERPQHATVVAGGGAAADLPAKRLPLPGAVLEVV